MDKMSIKKEKTFGFKASDDDHSSFEEAFQLSGFTSKDEWMKSLISKERLDNIKEGHQEYKQDLNELQMHTSRIYELTANMIQRANYLQDAAVRGLDEKLASRDLTITELQNNVKTLKEQLSAAEEGFKQNEGEKTELSGQLEEMRAANSNNQDLIKEYKEKVDTLSSLVNEYKGYAAENVELKQAHTAEKEQMKTEFAEKESEMVSSIEKLKATARDQAALIEQLEAKLNKAVEDHKGELENQKVNFNNQLTQLTDRKELEKERAILKVEREYQAKLAALQEQYNEKITRLYEKLDKNDEKAKKQSRDK
jgi:chromosome segregation ATPase